jgi:acyl carrier protein
MSDIAERLKKIVVEHLGVDADKVTENASFIDDLGADSLDNVAAEKILTVKDAIEFVKANAKS